MKNYNDYRKEISKIVDKNKGRINLTEVFTSLNISKGNYYRFMSNKEDKVLSYEKLDLLLAELKKLDNDSTNKEMLDSMSSDQMALFIEKNIINNPKRSQIDIKSWLKAHKPDMIYKDKK